MPLSPHSRTVLRDLGVVLHVPGIMALLSLPVCWLFNEPYGALPMLLTAATSLVPGQVLFRLFRGAEPLSLRHAMVTTVASWTIIPLIGALPFLLIGLRFANYPEAPQTLLPFADAWNAAFESVSGFTSTGLTMAGKPSELPHCLQWWRSFTQWVGGVGVVVLSLSVFHPAGDAQRLYFSEGREQFIVPDVTATVRAIWWIYLLYTLSAVALLSITGMGWWHAVNYAMTGIATGGFGVTDHSLADFSFGSQLAMVIIMVFGAISFAAHYRILTKRQIKWLRNDAEYRTLFLLLATGAFLIVLENRWSTGRFLWMDSLFQWTSAFATAGFSTTDLATWSPSAHLLLSLAMICGGAAGATTGGLKLKRIVILARGVGARIRGIALHPWRLMEHKPMADAKENRRSLEPAAVMAVLWVVTILAGTLLLLHAVGSGFMLNQVIFEICSALGNVGLSTGIVAPTLHWSGKLGLMIIMWLGRLEIVPVLVLIAAMINAPRRHNKAAARPES